MSDYSYKYFDPLELYARVTKDYYLTTPNPVPADNLIDVKPVDKPHGSGVDSKKFHNDVGMVGLPSDVVHEFEESAPRELVISLDSLLDSISLQLAYEGGSSVELSSAHGSIRFYTSSDEILYLDYVDGNVGIGTMSPLYKLDVVGAARFSDSVKVGEYWLPREVGDSGEVLAVGGDGKLGWYSISALWDTGGGDTYPCSTCVDWFYSNVHNVVYTALWETPQVCTTAFVGIARGHAGNSLYGDASTHINFGVESQTSESGVTHEHCLVLGGLRNKATKEYDIVVGGKMNEIYSDFGLVGNGSNNYINLQSDYSCILIGDSNRIDEVSGYSIIIGGKLNKITNSEYSIIYGKNNKVCGITAHSGILSGENNEIFSSKSIICCGEDNIIYNNSDYSIICAGENDSIKSSYGVIVGGSFNKIFDNSNYSFIGNGSGNVVASGAEYSVISCGLKDTVKGIWSGVFCGDSNVAGNGPEDTAIVIAGGYGNRITEKFSAICGGDNNLIRAEHGFIGGGKENEVYIDADFSTIGGGSDNIVKGIWSGVLSGSLNLGGNDATDTAVVIAGGYDNKILKRFSVICGGTGNIDSTAFGFIGGGKDNILESGAYYSVICGGRNNADTNEFSFIGGGSNNTTAEIYAVIVGGKNNYVWGPFTCILGGYKNKAGDQDYAPNDDSASVLCGGGGNLLDGDYCFLGGGRGNECTPWGTVLCGGDSNRAASKFSAIVGGRRNLIKRDNSDYSFIGAGFADTIDGKYSAIPSGYNNIIHGNYSFAFGESCRVSGDRSFAFGKKVNVTFNNQAWFYSQSKPGIVRITDILILTPRNSFPPNPVEGMIVVQGTSISNRHIYCYLRGDWRQLDN